MIQEELMIHLMASTPAHTLVEHLSNGDKIVLKVCLDRKILWFIAFIKKRNQCYNKKWYQPVQGENGPQRESTRGASLCFQGRVVNQGHVRPSCIFHHVLISTC